MAIYEDVFLRLHDNEFRRNTERFGRDTRRDMDRIGTAGGGAYGDAWAKAATAGIDKATARQRKAMDKAAAAADTASVAVARFSQAQARATGTGRDLLRIETELHQRRLAATRDLAAEERLENKLARTREVNARSITALARAHETLNKARRGQRDADLDVSNLMPSGGQGAIRQAATLGATLGNLSKVAGPVAMAALVSGAVQLAGVAASASQSLALLPAGVGGLVAGFATAKIATIGFSDALDNMSDPQKFSEALANLSPNAAQAAKSIKTLVDGPLQDLRLTAQDALFAGIGPQLEQLMARLGPSLQQMTNGIAGSMNSMLTGIMGQLATPETSSAITQTMANISTAFQNLSPALAPLTDAFAQIMQAGSSFLPDLATAAADAAREFSAFVSEASRSGDLKRFIGEGLDTLKQLVPILGDARDIFMALAPIGRDVLPGIAAGFRTVADVLPTIVQLVTDVKDTIGLAQDAAGMFFNGFATAPDVFSGMADMAVRAFDRIRGAMDTALTPIRAMVDLYNAIPGLPDIANIPSLNPAGTSGMPTPGALGGAPNASRERRGLAPVPTDMASGRFNGLGITGSSALSGALAVPAGSSGFVDWGVTGPSGGGGSSGSTSGTTSYRTAAEKIIALAQHADGGKYGWGQSDLENLVADCSGAVSDLVEIIKNGEAGPGRLFSTGDAASVLESLGATRGFKPGALNIGFVNGGPGGGHMAATLPNGVNFESGGAHGGIMYGKSAKGARDFREIWNLPVDGADPFAYDPDRTQRVSIEDISTTAAQTLAGPIGASIDQDFGLSRGLPGLFENLFKVIANAAFAPVLGALGAVSTAYGSTPGGGLLSLLGGGPSNPGTLTTGGYSPTFGATSSSGGYRPAGAHLGSTGPSLPGLGNFGAPGGTGAAARGIGAGTASAYASQPIGAWPFGELTTGTAYTPSRGRMYAEGKASQQGGFAPSGGGLLGLAQSAASMAASGAAGAFSGGAGGPAAGQAAQIGFELINRGIQYGSQLAGIGIEGLMETLLPIESELADPSRGWVGKFLGAMAGVGATVPNMAGGLTESLDADGGRAPLTAQQAEAHASIARGQDATNKAGTTQNITVNNHGAQPDYNGQTIARHALAAAKGPRR